MRCPASLRPRRLNSIMVFGARRTVLPSSNSISARPVSRVLSRVPCVIGRFRNPFSNPVPVFLSISTDPCTSLKRTMRACESAIAGSATSAQAKATRTTCSKDDFGLSIQSPREGLPSLSILEHDFCPKVSPNSEASPAGFRAGGTRTISGLLTALSPHGLFVRGSGIKNSLGNLDHFIVYGAVAGNRILERDGYNLVGTQRSHASEFATMDHVNGADAITRCENPIEGARRSTPLDVTEHDTAGFKSCSLFNLAGQDVTDAAQFCVTKFVLVHV